MSNAKAPEPMIDAAARVFIRFDRPAIDNLCAQLDAAVRWLDGILHESNVDFHRAILKREEERYPEGTLTYELQRVAFEFGASFARQYVRSLFSSEESDVPECVKDILEKHFKPKGDPTQIWVVREPVMQAVMDAYEKGRADQEKHKDEPPKAIRHLICKPDGAWPPSRQLYNACIVAAYEAGKESREP